MLRAAVREGTELGKMAKAIIDAGGLVGDDIMVGLVSERLAEDDARVRGYILDGFPRTSRPLDLAIDLVVPRELVLARLSIRRVCRDCGTNYQATGHETSQWSCDNCGGDVVQRDDDTPDAINRRLDLYESQTEPLIDFYGKTGRLAQVDGVGSPEEVFGRLTEAVEQRR
jgi:adenylate kinase